jgi:hypothetical protein
MSVPVGLDGEAKRLLNDEAYLWDDMLFAFRRTRQVRRESTEEYRKMAPVVISFEDLEDHGLIAGEFRSYAQERTLQQRHESLRWLRERIEQQRSHSGQI